MPSGPLPAELDALLRRPNPAVVGTVKPDGTPHTVATWYLWEDGRILLNMDDSRKRLAYMQPGAPVALTVMSEDDWYYHISFRGVVASLEPDVGLVDIDRLSLAYFGQSYHDRERSRTSAWIDVTMWHAWERVGPRD